MDQKERDYKEKNITHLSITKIRQNTAKCFTTTITQARIRTINITKCFYCCRLNYRETKVSGIKREVLSIAGSERGNKAA